MPPKSNTTKSVSVLPTIDDDPDFYKGNKEFVLPNGDKYVGDFCAHVTGLLWREGFGVYYTKDGQSYSGEWTDDKLIEESRVNVVYADGTEYEGYLPKNKYGGPAIYTFKENLKLIANFVDNKPVGDLILLDKFQRLWFGVADAENASAILYPENIYFENIARDKGVGVLRYRMPKIRMEESASEPSSSMSSSEIRRLAFTKSSKLTQDIDFEKSEWYSNYVNFKKQQQIIMYKVRKHGFTALTPEEMNWYDKYMEFKNRYEKFMDKRKTPISDSVDYSLLKTFHADEYLLSKPTKVVYPTKSSSSSSADDGDDLEKCICADNEDVWAHKSADSKSSISNKAKSTTTNKAP